MAVTVPSVKRIAMIGGMSYPTGPAAELHTCLQGLSDASGALDYKASCRIATASALPAYTRVANVITADANGALNGHGSVDGVTLVVGDRVLLKNGAAGADNGIYTVTALGGASAKWKLTRASDANTSAQVTSGMFTEIEEGTANTGTAWLLSTANPITLNTTALTFTQWSGAINRVDGTVSTQAAGDTASAGVSNKTAAADHKHAMPAADAAQGTASFRTINAVDGNIQPIGTQAAGNSLVPAAANHVHAHGAQALGDGTNHAVATAAFAGFQSATDKSKQDNTRLYHQQSIPGAALGAGVDNTSYFHIAAAPETITSAKIVMSGTPTAQPAANPNDLVVEVYKNATLVASQTYVAAMPAAGTYDALVLSGVAGALDLAANDVLSLVITQNGTCALGPASGLSLVVSAVPKA